MEGHSLLYTVPLHPEMIKMGSFSKVEQQSITKALERASTGTTSTALDPQVSAMLPMFQGKGASNNSSISLQYFFIKACGDVENACGVMDPSEWWNANHKSFKGVAKLARVWLAGSMVLPLCRYNHYFLLMKMEPSIVLKLPQAFGMLPTNLYAPIVLVLNNCLYYL
jgi:hypothetical protein